jgi:dTMP kinase
MERENIDFYNKVREGYLLLAKNMPDRVILVDGTHTTAHVAQAIWEHVQVRLGQV